MGSEITDIDKIGKTIIDFALGDFSGRMEVSGKGDDRDIIIAGINMLGEELEQTTISRDYFSSVYNAVSDILIVTDLNGNITDANEAVQKATGIPKEGLIGLSFDFFLPNSIELPSKLECPFNFETLFTKAKVFPVSCSVSMIVNGSGNQNGYLIIAKDITEQKIKKEQDLKLIISTQEKERKRFAYDLHDSLGQELNAINFILSTLSHIGKDNEQFDEIFEKCVSMAKHSVGTVKKIAFDVMPKSLEDGNITCALEELCNSLEDVSNINYHFDDESNNLEVDNQVIIYRVFQEFVINSVKHSDSNIINLLITNSGDSILFVLSDDGIGFDRAKVNLGNGVRNIESRLESIKANYQFTSDKLNGTNLKFEIPL